MKKIEKGEKEMRINENRKKGANTVIAFFVRSKVLYFS